MKKIGFKVTDNKLAVIEEHFEEEYITAEEILRAAGREKLLKLVDEYTTPYAYPLLKGDRRDEFFIERLRRINERYFEPL